MNGATPRSSAAPAEGETAPFPRAVPCGDHAFDDALVCRCGVSWSTHQRLPATCPLNARGRNRGEEEVGPPTRRRHP